MITNDFIDDLGSTSSKQKLEIWKKINENLRNFLKITKDFIDVKYMTNYLPFETYPRVLAQFLQKCEAVKDSYFQVQKNVKNREKIWS